MFEKLKRWFAEERRKRREVQARVRPMVEEMKREQERERAGYKRQGKKDER